MKQIESFYVKGNFNKIEEKNINNEENNNSSSSIKHKEKINTGTNTEANNDYERIDLNQIVKYPQLKCDGIKVFSYAKKNNYNSFSFLTNKIDDEIKRLQEESEKINFNDFIDNHNIDDLIINDDHKSNEFLDFLNTLDIDGEIKKQEEASLEELIKSIDEEIDRLEKEGFSAEKNDFEKFLEENSYDEVNETLNTDEDADETLEQLLEAIDKEIALLEEKVNEDNKNEFNDIIRRIDEEIERLESEETVKDEAENTRNDFIDFLNSHNIDEIVSENLKDDDEATVIEIE